MTLDTLRARAHTAEPILWNFLGDSITHGALHTYGWRDYVELFDERIRFELGRQQDLVINAAYSGYSVPRLAAELDHRCLRFRPQIVSIMLGTNDAKEGATNVDRYRQGLTDIVQTIQTQTNALVFLQTPTPIDVRNAPERESLPLFVEAMHQVGHELGVPVCDHYAAWNAAATKTGRSMFMLLSDPFHPNEHGHRFMARTLLEWLGYGPWANTSPWAAF